MTFHGPIYCETGHPWLFMAEPVNTITNIFILLAAVMAWRAVRRARIGTPPDLAALIFLLFVTSIGSFFWHAFRTRLALDFDAFPGLLFLLLFSALWMRALFGGVIAVAGTLCMIGAAILGVWVWARMMPSPMPSALLFVPGFIVIAATGLGMAAATAGKFGARAARLGLVVMVCAIPAAIFRSIDLMVCSVIPIGTHFLWHILLAAAAYLGIVLLLRMRAGRQRNPPCHGRLERIMVDSIPSLQRVIPGEYGPKVRAGEGNPGGKNHSRLSAWVPFPRLMLTHEPRRE